MSTQTWVRLVIFGLAVVAGILLAVRESWATGAVVVASMWSMLVASANARRCERLEDDAARALMRLEDKIDRELVERGNRR